MVVVGCTRRAVAAARRRARGVARAVHAGGAGHRARDRLRLLVGVRRVAGARRVPRRARRERVRHEPPGGGRRLAAARRVRGALLRLGRHVAGPDLPGREPAAGARGRAADRRHEGHHEVRDRDRRGLPDPGRPDGGGRTRPDRRVLVHRRDGRARPRPAAGRRLPADRRRSAAVDHGQPAGAPRHRSDRGAAARDARHREPAAAAGRGARDPGRGHAGGPAPARHRVRLRPGGPDDRAGARAPRVPLHRRHPATRRGRPPAGARDPGRLRRRREPRGHARWPRSSTPG